MNINSNAKTLGQLLLSTTKNNLNRKLVGLTVKGESTTYTGGEYLDIIQALANALEEYEFKMGTKVSILSQSSFFWHIMDITLMATGKIVVPIYPTYLEDEIKFHFNHSESEILVVENNEQLKKVIKIQAELPALKLIIAITAIDPLLIAKINMQIKFIHYRDLLSDGKKLNQKNYDFLKTHIQKLKEDDVATIIYTSGTTGEPKGAVITHGAFYQMLSNLKISLGNHFSANDHSLVFLPLSHVLGRCDSYLHFAVNNSLTFAESIKTVLGDLQKVRPTLLISVPRIFEKFYYQIQNKIADSSPFVQNLFHWSIKVSQEYFSTTTPTFLQKLKKQLAYLLILKKINKQFGGKIRYFVSGGAPISVEIINFLQCAHLFVLEGYGLTETVAPCTVNSPEKIRPGTVGFPIGDVKIKLADDGEILINSKALFKGYYHNPEATADALIDGWLHTGDVGLFTPEGHLKITDRKKDLIITSGGKNVAPVKIESLLKQSPYITHAVIIGNNKKYLTALIGIEKTNFTQELNTWGLSQEISHADLVKTAQMHDLIKNEIAKVNQKLARFEAVQYFHICDKEFTTENGLLTPSLKVKRNVAITQYQTFVDAMYPTNL